jgi:hypothetical protein
MVEYTGIVFIRLVDGGEWGAWFLLTITLVVVL